jgi:hypothetical protein
MNAPISPSLFFFSARHTFGHSGVWRFALYANGSLTCSSSLTRALLQATTAPPTQQVQVFGRKKTATAVALCKKGWGVLKVNGTPIELMQPETLRVKVRQPFRCSGKGVSAVGCGTRLVYFSFG